MKTIFTQATEVDQYNHFIQAHSAYQQNVGTFLSEYSLIYREGESNL